MWLRVVKSNVTPESLPKVTEGAQTALTRMGVRGKDGNESFPRMPRWNKKEVLFGVVGGIIPVKLNYKQHLTMMKSTQQGCISPSRKGKHINASERQQIECWRLKGMSVAQVATLLQRHRSTVYQELKRGTVINKRSDWSVFRAYRAQRAHNDYLRNSGAGGPYLKLT